MQLLMCLSLSHCKDQDKEQRLESIQSRLRRAIKRIMAQRAAILNVKEDQDYLTRKIMDYIVDSTQPTDKLKAQKLIMKVSKNYMFGGKLQKISYSRSLLKYLDPRAAMKVNAKMHKKHYGNQSSGRSMAQRIMMQGLHQRLQEMPKICSARSSYNQCLSLARLSHHKHLRDHERSTLVKETLTDPTIMFV